jgi:hypothetical protein
MSTLSPLAYAAAVLVYAQKMAGPKLDVEGQRFMCSLGDAICRYEENQPRIADAMSQHIENALVKERFAK